MSLYLTDDTDIDDVVEFLETRLADPAVIDDVVVWNFRNEGLVTNDLLGWAEEAESGAYIVPYQVSGVWAFMSNILPRRVSEARLLAHRSSEDRYVDYDNWTAENPDDLVQPRRRLMAELAAQEDRLPEGWDDV